VDREGQKRMHVQRASSHPLAESAGFGTSVVPDGGVCGLGILASGIPKSG